MLTTQAPITHTLHNHTQALITHTLHTGTHYIQYTLITCIVARGSILTVAPLKFLKPEAVGCNVNRTC